MTKAESAELSANKKAGKPAKARTPKAAKAKARKAVKAKGAAKDKTAKPGAGRLGTIFDHPVTSVIRALGLDGVSIADARAIMKAKGVAIPDKSCDVQVSLGRTKARPAAPLTKEQLDELKALIPAVEKAA